MESNYAIQTEEVDGYTIIKGFVPRSIDPEATKAAARVVVVGTDIDGDGNDGIPELKPMRQKQAEMDQYLKEAADAKQKALAALRSADEIKAEMKTLKDPVVIADKEKQYKVSMKAFEDYEKKRALREKQFWDANEELKPIVREFEAAKKEVIRAHPVYFEPGLNQVVKEAQETQELIGKWGSREPGTVIDIEGQPVPDFRGKQYFYKSADGVWVESEVISRLGDTMATVVVDEYEAVAIEKEDLTTEQKEEIRLQKLSAEDKAAEYESKRKALVSRAAQMKVELEIEGEKSAAALSQSQAWYQTELTELKTIYGVV